VIPTRTNLLRAKRDLALAVEGHRLLDQKREVLLLELMQYVTRLREQARQAREKLDAGYRAIDAAEVAMGSAGLEDASFGPVEPPAVSALERSVMGVAIPTVREEHPGRAPDGGLAGTVPELDEGAAALREAVPEILRWAASHLAVYRLAAEVRKTQRRVNALGEVFIPRTRSRIAGIAASLEEAEREEFFRRKRVKAKLRLRGAKAGDAA